MSSTGGPRVIMTSEAADRNGADVVLRHVAHHLHQLGAEIEIVLPSDGPGLAPLQATGVRVVVDRRAAVIRRSDLTPFGVLRFMIAAPVAFLAHLRAIRRFNPDLVWVNTVLVPMWILAGRALRRRVVVHDHEIVSGSVLVRRLAYAPLMLAHVVIVVSEAARADIAAVYPKLAARAVVLTNRSFEITTPVPVEDPASIDIVMMGRIDERKGQHILLEALNEMTFPNPAPTVHICGEPYPPGSAAAEQYHARLVRAAARAPIPVRMHGYVNRVEALRMGSIVVVPSTISEPWSLVVSEALTAGRAVVASDSGGVSEQLAGYGTLVPPNDPQALARALQALLDDPARRAGEVQRALEWPRRFSLDDYFTHIAAIAFGQPG